MNVLNEFEIKILEFLQNNSCKFLDIVMPYITYLCEFGLLSLILAVVFLIFPKTRKMGLTLLIAILAGYLIVNKTLKPAFERVRPYNFKPIQNMLIAKKGGYAFPSGHTLVAFETAMSIFLYKRKWGKFCFALAFAVGFSRMYLYMHYPTDVIAGAVIGVIIAYISYRIVNVLWERLNKKV